MAPAGTLTYHRTNSRSSHLFDFSVSMIEQEGSGKALASLKNLAAERYWDARWQREWETKYHDPLVVSQPQRYTLKASPRKHQHCNEWKYVYHHALYSIPYDKTKRDDIYCRSMADMCAAMRLPRDLIFPFSSVLLLHDSCCWG